MSEQPANTQLIEERQFLLSSIRDLDSEFAAGDVDADDYRSLRAGYTARAAAVLRAINAGRSDVGVADEPGRSRRLLAWLGGAAVVGTVVGVALAGAIGQRQPNQGITGGEVNEVAAQLGQAQQLLSSDPAGALALYDAVLDVEPENPEALTYSSWLIVLQGRQQGDDATIELGIEGLAAVTRIDPSYADATCLLGVANGRMLTEPRVAEALAAIDQCLALNPPASIRGMVEGLRTELAG